jgi:small-conductance mechanosensitive channel
VPLSYFIEKPFQNWTRESSALLGTTFLYVDYRAPVGLIRDKLHDIVKQSKDWDGNIVGLQVTDAKEQTMELRCLMSAASAGQSFDLRCEVREKLIAFLNEEHPEALPVRRQLVVRDARELDDSERENARASLAPDADEPARAAGRTPAARRTTETRSR